MCKQQSPAPHTQQQQLVDQALGNAKHTGLHPQVVIEWNMLGNTDETWNNFGPHFIKAYQMRLDSGPTTIEAGYHGAALVRETDNDSLSSITGSIAYMQITNITNTQSVQEGVSAMTNTTNKLWQVLPATQ